MDLDSALRRYLRNPEVNRWLFSTEPVTTVTPQHLDECFVYSIGIGNTMLKMPNAMNIEDMLIVTSTSGTFVLGVLWGFGQPHLFARTPFMADMKPVSRRFAVDLSTRDALEFMEFDTFDNGKVMVAFRRFLHTRDSSLPCLVNITLHAPSNVRNTLGPVIVRASLLEAASCPACGQVGSGCFCNFNEEYAPFAPIKRQTVTWGHFTSQFMNKTRIGTVRFSISAVLANFGEVPVANQSLHVVNVLQKGNTKYLNLLRRKAVHGLGVNVVAPRIDSFVLSYADENDFVSLHNQYMARKRARVGTFEPVNDYSAERDKCITLPHDVDEGGGGGGGGGGGDGSNVVAEPTRLPTKDLSVSERVHTHSPIPPRTLSYQPTSDSPDSIYSVDDMLSIFPTMSDTSNMLTTGVPLEPNQPESEANFNRCIETISNTCGSKRNEPAESSVVPGVQLPNASSDSLFGSSKTPIFDTSTICTPPPFTNRPPTPRTAQHHASILNEIEHILSPTEHPEKSTADNLAGTSGDTVTDQIDGTGSSQSLCSVQSDKQIASEDEQDDADARKDSVERKSGKKVGRKRTKRKASSSGDGELDDNDEDKKHACKKCSSRFKMRGDLLRHVKIVHEGKKMYTCQFCSKKFGHSGHLNRHIQSVHLHQRRFKCQLCGFQFYQASHLQSHMNHIHNEKKGTTCKGCGLRLKSQAAHRNHEARCQQVVNRADEAGLTCTWKDCMGKFANQQQLDTHITMVHGPGASSLNGYVNVQSDVR